MWEATQAHLEQLGAELQQCLFAPVQKRRTVSLGWDVVLSVPRIGCCTEVPSATVSSVEM